MAQARLVAATPFSVPALYNAIPGNHKLLFKVACTGHFMAWESQRRVFPRVVLTVDDEHGLDPFFALALALLALVVIPQAHERSSRGQCHRKFKCA